MQSYKSADHIESPYSFLHTIKNDLHHSKLFPNGILFPSLLNFHVGIFLTTRSLLMASDIIITQLWHVNYIY